MGLLYNLARMTTATVGTGTLTLGTNVGSFLTFAQAGVTNGQTVSYAIEDGANREIGEGVYTSVGTTLTRVVTKSTNADAAISLSGTAQVFITPRKEDFDALLPKAGGTMTGNITFSVDTESLILSGGGKLYDLNAGATTILANNDWLQVYQEAGATLLLEARYSTDAFNFKGNYVYRAGGVDIPITDGGTGQSSAGAALTALGGQPSDAELTALAGLTSAADRLPYFTGSGAASLATYTAFARTLDDDADAATARGTLAAAAIGANTFTGDQTISKTTPTLALIKSSATDICYIQTQNGANRRWVLRMPDGTAEGGSNAGSDLILYRYADADTLIGAGFSMTRSDGIGIFYNTVVKKPGAGGFTDSSDIRIKNVVGDYRNGLAQIVGLKPIRYMFKANDTSVDPALVEDPEDPTKMVRVDGLAAPYKQSVHYHSVAQEFVGLVAQDLEKDFPECVSLGKAYIDGQPVEDLRTVDASPLVYALINAVKELEARIRILEGK